MASAHVPKSGSWEGKAIQVTKSFENALQDRVAGFNPNDLVKSQQAFIPSQPTQEQPCSRKMQKKFSSSSSKMAHIDPPRLSTSKMKSHSDIDKGNVHQKPPSFPKFGGWDESGQRAEYTVVFNEVKEKKQAAATKLPAVPKNTAGSKNNQKTSSKMLCCFCI